MKQFCSFSEAIRAGIPLAPQAFSGGRVGMLCALEAGLHALTGRHNQALEHIYEAFPYMRTVVACPVADCSHHHLPDTLVGMIWRINDHHRWTREAIADWLESAEEKLGFVTVVEGESARSHTEAVSEMVMV